MERLLNKKYVFDDGDSIEVIQLKLRDEGQYWVTYQIQQGPGIPRKLTMSYSEFMDEYGHLFED